MTDITLYTIVKTSGSRMLYLAKPGAEQDFTTNVGEARTFPSKYAAKQAKKHGEMVRELPPPHVAAPSGEATTCGGLS